MDDIFGLSWRKLLEIVLSILALVFFLIEGNLKIKEEMGLLAILVVVYLGLILIFGMARRSDMFGAGGVMAMESAFGILLIIHTIKALANSGHSTLETAALIMDLIVGILFLIFILF